MQSLEQLIRSCQQGKKESQYELVKRYSGMLMTVCRRYTRDNATAKDILQESFIRIFTHIGKYKPTGSFEGWMRRITARCALQWIDRKYFRKEAFQEAVPETPAEPDIYSHLALEDIIALIQELTPNLRAVFNLYVVEGYSHGEIGELLGITESSSRSSLVRARQALQKKINSIQLIKNKPA
jgi:RNA polymerase sigma-70 factor (ECF subfamily)